MGFGRWLAGGLGWAFFGPIGGIIGFVAGSLLDTPTHSTNKTTRGDFNVSLLVLVAAVMKADGKILRSELNFVKQNFIQIFGKEQTKEALLMLKDILKKDIPVVDVCRQIRTHIDNSSKLQLYHFLYAIAQSDGVIDKTEVDILEVIAREIGLSKKDAESIKYMFIDDTDSAYKILEIDKTATNDEIKKQYKKLAIKYHPDKVAYLGKDMQEAAKVKFQKLNDAYEKIKKERGFN